MTLTLERLKVATGPILDNSRHNEVSVPQARKSDTSPELSAEEVERVTKNFSQIGKESFKRTALLGIVLAELESVPFELISILLEIKQDRLVKMMHGDIQLQGKFDLRGEALVEIARNLHRVIEADATTRWLNTAIPDLDGKTPLDMIDRGGIQRVVDLTRSYLDPSFA